MFCQVPLDTSLSESYHFIMDICMCWRLKAGTYVFRGARFLDILAVTVHAFPSRYSTYRRTFPHISKGNPDKKKTCHVTTFFVFCFSFPAPHSNACAEQCSVVAAFLFISFAIAVLLRRLYCLAYPLDK